MKTYEVEMWWLKKGRYWMRVTERIKASNVGSAVGKAIRGKKDGYRESAGAVLQVKATVLLTNGGE